MTIEALFSCAPTLALLTLSVFMAQGMWRMAQPPHSLRPREALHESPRRVHLRTRVVWGLAFLAVRDGSRLQKAPGIPSRPALLPTHDGGVWHALRFWCKDSLLYFI